MTLQNEEDQGLEETVAEIEVIQEAQNVADDDGDEESDDDADDADEEDDEIESEEVEAA